jgi:hypothetical protein
MDIVKCAHCGMQVVPKTDGTCPSCQRNPSAAVEQEPVVATVVEKPTSYKQSNVSHLRGVGFGCLYAFLTWVLVGIAAIFLVPFFSGNLTHEGLGEIASMIGIAIAIPFGVYGFLKHQYFNGPD